MLVLLLAGAARAERAEDLVSEARRLEIQEQAFDAALGVYRQVLDDPGAGEALRGKALIGAARCCDALARYEEMKTYVSAALEIAGLSERDRGNARALLQSYADRKKEELVDAESDRRTKERLAELQSKRIETAQEFLEAGWVAFRAKRYDEARKDLWRANGYLGGETAETRALWDALESVLPDRGEILRDMMEFLQTTQVQYYQQLRAEVEDLYQAAKDQFGKKSYRAAGELIVDAVRRIDTSGFLGSPFGEGYALQQDRDKLVFWLRDIRERARAAGVEVPPEPELPERRGGGSDVQKRFYDLLAESFGSLSGGKHPLRFYEMGGFTRGAASPWLSSSLQGGLRVSHAPGPLSRARWAERWIRANVPGHWDAPERPVVGRPGGESRGSSQHTLARFGNVVCVQHNESAHRRVETIRASFGDKPTAVVADVHLLVTDTAGVVRASQELAAHAGPRESGHDLVLRNRIVRECIDVLTQLEGTPIDYLGSAELHLAGESTSTLEVTALTVEHPQFRNLSLPVLSVSEADARFGLWLEIYAEPLPNVGAPPQRSAMSLVARVRNPVGSVNLPKPAGDLPFIRVPRMTEQRLESDRELPNFGCLMLLGLENPFPQTDPRKDQLIVLIGLREEGAGTPDPEPLRAGPIAPSDTRLVERSIGALAAEVVDHLVQEDWPRQRAASEPAPLPTLREDRSRYLEWLIRDGDERLAPDGRPRPELPISVGGNQVSGLLGPDEVERLDRVLAVLTSHDADLYDVDLVSVVASRDRFTEWSGSNGASTLREGFVRLEAGANQAMDPRMRSETAEGLFTTARRQNARASQRIGFKRLAVETIVRDQHVRRVGTDRSRYAAITGVVEEGLIVEVRPGLEQEDGYRTVYVRVRADRLKGIERTVYPGSAGDVFLEIPEWHGLEDLSGAYPMKDGEALLIGVPYPGASERVIAVKVAVRKRR